MEVQLDVTTIISALALIFSGYSALGRGLLGAKERAIETRLEDLEELSKSHSRADTEAIEKTHVREVRLTQLDGELALERERVKTLTEMLAEVRETLVTRHEFEKHAERVERQLDELAKDVRRVVGPGRYSSSATVPSVIPRPGSKKDE
jgi:hypothetical protein